jgi:hypothetical protein
VTIPDAVTIQFDLLKISMVLLKHVEDYNVIYIIVQGVPLATEPGIEDIATKFEQEYVRYVRNEE